MAMTLSPIASAVLPAARMPMLAAPNPSGGQGAAIGAAQRQEPSIARRSALQPSQVDLLQAVHEGRTGPASRSLRVGGRTLGDLFTHINASSASLATTSDGAMRLQIASLGRGLVRSEPQHVARLRVAPAPAATPREVALAEQAERQAEKAQAVAQGAEGVAAQGAVQVGGAAEGSDVASKPQPGPALEMTSAPPVSTAFSGSEARLSAQFMGAVQGAGHMLNAPQPGSLVDVMG